MNLQFTNPWVLFLLWLVPAVGVWWYVVSRRRERKLESFISRHMQKKLRPASSASRFAWQAGLITSALFLILIAVARPQWGTKEEIVYQRGRDLVIALDVSRSMLANDVHPSRLQRAKADIMDLIKELRGDRAALLAFRHKAVLLCPLTTDYAYLKQSLDAASIDSAPRGETNIGDAITRALETFESDEGSHKAIILISDGEDLTGKAAEAAEDTAKRNIPIFTVGLGSRKGSKIPDQDNRHKYAEYKGKDIVTKLNHETLYSIANTTGGAYIPVETASMTSTTLGTLYRDHLRKISAQDLEETLQRRYVERYQIFLLPAVLLLLAGAFLSRGRLCAEVPQSGTPAPTTDNGLPRRSLMAKAGQRLASPKPNGEGGTTDSKDLNPRKQPLKNLIILIGFTVCTLTATAVTNEQAPNSQLEHPTSNIEHRTSNPAKPTSDRSNIEHRTSNIQHRTPGGREGARIAQKLYMLGKYDEAAEAYLEAAKGSTRKSQRDFRYNAAAALFKAKKYKESADILRGLIHVEKDTSTPTLTGLGSALYRTAELPEKPENEQVIESARLLRESGEAFKDAVRAKPDNESARRNLAVVLEALPEAEEQAKIAKLMTEYEQVPASRIADEMLSNQRKLIEEIPTAFTNGTPASIRQLESLAERQRANTDLWIPLKGKLLNAMAQQQMAGLDQFVETTRDNMLDAASSLRDLDPGGYDSALASEAATYLLWKGIAPYGLVLQEDLRRQTNIISMSTAKDPQLQTIKVDLSRRSRMAKAEQDKALNLTKLFKERFSAAVPEGGKRNGETGKQGNGDKEPQTGISAEDRQKILGLADRAVIVQENAVKLLEKNNLAESLIEQQESYALLKQIEELLPRDQKEQDQEKQNKQKEQQKDQQQEAKQEPQPKPQQDEEKPSEQESKKQEQEPEQKEATPALSDEALAESEQIRKLLERALQREREHEAEKRRRNRLIPLPPLGRDW